MYLFVAFKFAQYIIPSPHPKSPFAYISGMCDVPVRWNSRQTEILLKAVGHDSRQVSYNQSEGMFETPQPMRATSQVRGTPVRAVRPAHSERIIADVGSIWSMHMTWNDGICELALKFWTRVIREQEKPSQQNVMYGYWIPCNSRLV